MHEPGEFLVEGIKDQGKAPLLTLTREMILSRVNVTLPCGQHAAGC